MKLFKIDETLNFGDIQHEDGSKTYQTAYGEAIHIARPSVVDFIEEILDGGYVGWGYMNTLKKQLENEIITEEEYNKIIRILD